jgi:hypothetical protein
MMRKAPAREYVEATIRLPSDAIVAARPATVTQRTCLEHFGLSKRDYLRLVARGAFPVHAEGMLRIARYGDVERYLTESAAPRRRQRVDPKKPRASDPLAGFDAAAALRRAGFR